MNRLQQIYDEIFDDPSNAELKQKGYFPVYTASERAKIMIVGQAPGRKAQDSGRPWHDLSGVKLRAWLGITDEQFYDPDLFALVPMDFYYPGKGAHGDLPPRKGFSARWHPKLLAEMKDIQLIVLVGNYAQKYYLGQRAKANLTQTVLAYQEYMPKFLPLVHPSPLNFRWQTINPWFEAEVVPVLASRTAEILAY